MASHHDDDTMPEQTEGYKLSQPKQSLAEYHQMGMLSSSFAFDAAAFEVEEEGERVGQAQGLSAFWRLLCLVARLQV